LRKKDYVIFHFGKREDVFEGGAVYRFSAREVERER
jgi:hypothetical protein